MANDNNGEKAVMRKENQLFRWLVPILLTAIIGMGVVMWKDVKADIQCLEKEVKTLTTLHGNANTVDAAMREQIVFNKERIRECKAEIKDLRKLVSP